MYKASIERVIRFFSDDRYLEELKGAKDEYFRRTGKVFEDEAMFEGRMSAFTEWFVLDRLLVDTGIPPVRLFRLMHSDSLSAEEQAVLAGFEMSNHSLFRFIGKSRDVLRVADLFDEKVFEISERRNYPGLVKGDVLDARLVLIQGRTVFSEAMWVHPRKARDFILDEVRKKRGKKRDMFETLVFDLAYMKLKADRYQHLPNAQIYNWESFARDRVETDRRIAGV